MDGIRILKPVSPGTRNRSVLMYSALTRSSPEKSLLLTLKKNSGRNNYGRITSRRRGGGHKQRYRIIDFSRDKVGIPAKVAHIEYDPNRTAFIALLHYVDGEKRYIIATEGMQQGDILYSGKTSDIRNGNALQLVDIPVGTVVCCVELEPGRGARLVRSAGAFAQLVAKDHRYATLRLPSGEVRKVLLTCMATIGTCSNVVHNNVRVGKAGANRWRGKRPSVRGVAMNPIDHPHGGGEGRSSGGRHPVSPWGVPTKGYKTRDKKKKSEQFIIKHRAKRK